MRLLSPAGYRTMPWKNGGGSTVELYRHGSSPEGFDWRISIATVPGDGPFSSFVGYDRHIMAIDGEGFVLEGGPGGPIKVFPLFEARRFSGDWSIFGRVRNGPSRDFNLIARRDLYDSRMDCLASAANLAITNDKGWTFIHVFSGLVRWDDTRVKPDSSLLLEPGETGAFRIGGDNPRVALCTVMPRTA